MEVALERACIARPNGETHAARPFIATKILARAESGEKITSRTNAGRSAAFEFDAAERTA